VKNQGTETSEITKLVLYINGNPYDDWQVPALSKGESTHFSSAWTPLSEGPAEIRAVVDGDGLVAESNEGNNEKQPL